MSNRFADDAAREITDDFKRVLRDFGVTPAPIFVSGLEYDVANIIESAIDDALDEARLGDYETGREDAFGTVQAMIADRLYRIDVLGLDGHFSAREVLAQMLDEAGRLE